MAWSHQVDHSNKVIRLTFEQALTAADVITAHRVIRKLRYCRSGFALLIDFTGISDVHIGAEATRALARGDHDDVNLIALVASKQVVYGLSRVYQALADPLDRRICLFTSAECAEDWLRNQPLRR